MRFLMDFMSGVSYFINKAISERKYKNLKEFKGKRTMVVIAHRLSTVGNADYIYVIDKGKVIEAGTYDELHGKRGAFTKMVEDQKLVHI